MPESADAADVSMRLRERGWTPYALRLEREQHAWVALVMDWQHAAVIFRARFRHSRATEHNCLLLSG